MPWLFEVTDPQKVKATIRVNVWQMPFALRLVVRNVSFTAQATFARPETRPSGLANRPFLSRKPGEEIDLPVQRASIQFPVEYCRSSFRSPASNGLAGRNSWTDREQEAWREPVDSNSCHISRTQLIARPPREIVSRRSSSSSSRGSERSIWPRRWLFSLSLSPSLFARYLEKLLFYERLRGSWQRARAAARAAK